MIDIFKVGVHIGMTTNSSQVIATMMRELLGVRVAAGEVQTALHGIGKAAVGAAGIFAGWEVIKGLVDATKHAEKLNHELVKLQTGARLTDAQTNDASNLAFKISRDVRGTNVAENVRMQRELFGVFGDMEEAKAALPLVAQGSRATSSFVDKDTDLAKIAVRALELRGHITKDGHVNPAEFAQEFNSMVRSIVASEGLIDPAKLLQFIQQAGPAARGMNADEFWGKSPAIMNALGSSKAGTAMMSLFSQMVGHVVAGSRVAIAMEEAHMLTPGKWRVERGGKVVMDRDAVPDQAGFMDHPYSWLHDKLTELRARPGMDEVGIIQRIFQFSSRATSARLISDIDKNWPIIQNEEARYQRMPGAAGIAKEQNEKDASVNVKNLNEAWDNFMTALGKPGIPIMIGVLTKLTDALNFMQEAIIRHPTAAKDLFEIAGGIAALTALGGSITIFMVAWRPFVGGIRLIVGMGTGVATAGAGMVTLAEGIAKLAGPLGTIVAVVQETMKWASTTSNIHPDEKWGWGGSIHPNAAGPRSGSSLLHDYNKDLWPNKPWSGKTYGPNGNTNPDGTGKQSMNGNGVMVVHVANAGDIGRGMVGSLSEGTTRPSSGPTFQDYRYDLPTPGHAIG